MALDSKHRHKWVISLVLLMSIVCQFAVAKSANEYSAIKFNHVNTERSNFSQWALDVLQDSQGFIWTATQTGLYRYDGYEFKFYQHELDDPNSLANSYVVSLFEDSSKTLWVGTHDGVLHQYQPEYERFKRFMFDPEHPKTTISNSHVMSISESSDGQLLVGTLGAGLHVFDPSSKTFIQAYVHDSTDANSLSDNRVYSAIEDSQGMIWVGTRNGGVNRLDPATGEFTHFMHDARQPGSLSHNKVHIVMEDSKRNLWVGTRGGGLNLFDRMTQTFSHFRHDPNDKNSLGSDHVFAIFEDNLGDLWVGAYKGGLNKFNVISRDFNQYRYNLEQGKTLPDDDVFAITQDEQGLIWLGTFGGGIANFDPNSKRFGLNQHIPGNTNSLSKGEIHAIFKDREGILWIGTDDGLDRHDEALGQFTHYRRERGDPNSLSGIEVWSIAQDHDGFLWVGTRTGGLNRFDPKQQTFTHYRYDPNDPFSLSDDYVKELHVDSDGILWVGTQNGLNRFDAKTGKFERFVHAVGDQNSISHNVVNAIFADHDHNLWIGTNGGGFNRFYPQDSRFERFMNDPQQKNSLSSNTVYSMYQDDHGDMWIGTFAGLNKFNPTTKDFTHYGKKDGLQNNRIQSVFADGQGRLWLVGGGLSVFEPKTGVLRHRIGSEANCSANQGASLKTADGFLYFGTKSYCHFHPNDVIKESMAPRVIFTNFLLLNKPVAISSNENPTVMTQAVNYTDTISLTHEQNVFSFEFSALHFSEPYSNKYKYKLTGFNPDWIETDANNRHATYTNLSAGEYTFEVMASNSEGVWTKTPRQLKVVIEPAPWQTWWAFSVYALLVFLMIWSYGRMIHQSVVVERKTSKRLEQKVSERTAELEQSNQSITALSEISTEITSTLDLNKLLNIVYNRIERLMDVDVFGIGLYEPQQHRLNFQLAIEQGEYLPEYVVDMDEKERPAVWCIENKRPLILNDFDKDFAAIFQDKTMPTPKAGKQPGSLMYWPLIVGEHISGVLTVQSYRKFAYNEHQQEMIQALASTTAIALDNARAYREVANKNQTIMATQQQLVESEKMASLGILTAGVAHEINNPTNFVHVSAHNLATDMRNFKQVLLDLVGDDAEQEVLDIFTENFKPLFSHVDLIKTGTERIKRIVSDLSAFSQLDAQEQQPVNVVDCLLSTINLVHTKYVNQISFDTDFYPTQEISGFPAQLNQVFMNLLVNACDAIRDRSRQEAASGLISALRVAGQISIGCQQRGPWIEITFKDNGCGMDKTTQEKLFEPFYTTKPAGEGTGLGMSISYGIIQKHNGEILLESEVGVGTTFTLLLPCKAQEAADPQ